MESETVERYLPREVIDRQAVEILERHALLVLPVDPLAVARREQIGVFSTTFADPTIAGSISRKGSQTTILLNRSDPPTRKRFTIAHELGHYFLHLSKAGDQQFTDGENNLLRQPNKGRPSAPPEARREYQANLFAAALLMPAEKVRLYWQSIDSIREMSNLFGISDLAMSIRLGQLGLLDEYAV